MAKMHLSLTVRTKWWVRPLLSVAAPVAGVVGPFLSDEQVDRLAHALGAFVARAGMRFTVE
jgi:hypothetical protein